MTMYAYGLTSSYSFVRQAAQHPAHLRAGSHRLIGMTLELGAGMKQDTLPDDGAVFKRRVFLIQAGKAFPVVAGALYLIGCDEATGPSAVADIFSTSTLVNSHTHSVNVPSSDQLHPDMVLYTSSNEASHVHLVALSANQLTTLASGGTVTVRSTSSNVTGDHTHEFRFQGKKSS